MKGAWVALGVVGLIVVVVLLGAGSYITSRNHMVRLNEQVNSAYSEVDVQQQRRLDLIPNLVASVKGYVKEEETDPHEHRERPCRRPRRFLGSRHAASMPISGWM